jgi:hypothetical protein
VFLFVTFESNAGESFLRSCLFLLPERKIARKLPKKLRFLSFTDFSFTAAAAAAVTEEALPRLDLTLP